MKSAYSFIIDLYSKVNVTELTSREKQQKKNRQRQNTQAHLHRAV